MCSNTKKLAVIYPAVYCKQIVTPPRFTDKVKAFTLTAVGYPSVDGFTKRTYLIEYEEIATDN